MRLAGILRESDGYPLDDAPAMAAAVVRHCVVTCEREGVAPIGALTVRYSETSPIVAPDRAVRWDLVTDSP